MQDRLGGALYLIHRMIPVLPLHGLQTDRNGRLICTCANPACGSPGKHPIANLTPSGVSDATTDELTIRTWFKTAPLANLGLATGVTVVLDVDPRHGGDDSLNAVEAKYGQLPMTVRTLTGGGGQHIFLLAPDGKTIRNSAGRLAPGLDIRGAGGYVVAPPSLHASGQHYSWSDDHHPDHIMPAPMPDWLVQALTQSVDDGTVRDPSAWRQLVAEGVCEGARNTAVTRLSGHLLRRYVDAEVAHELVQAWNSTRCQPPLQPEEVTKIVGSIARKELRRREARNAITP